ncbi:MAG TPA: glycerol kinase GlpK [Rhodocyclaceae bacterium]|nr:glycerol kinase GlpK [Rhodocyclaceae bacterium]
MAFLLALDQGTSSSRAIVFDAAGRPVASAQREFRQHFPRPGWVEHDPDEIWNSQLGTAQEALAKARLSPAQIAGIGIANQRETTLVWDRRSGRPVYPAIVWQDRRTAPLCGQLRDQGLESLVRERTGLVVDPYFSATKIRWILDHVPGARDAARHGQLAFGTVDSWLAWRASGGRLHVTDVSNAARTMLFDIHRNRWDADLLDALDLPASLLPEVRPSSFRFGVTDAGVIGAEIPIGGIAGDQQAALFGQACFSAGLAKNTYGTGCFMLVHTGGRCETSANGLLTTSAAQVTSVPEFALEGSVFIGGAVVQWLRDGLQAIEHSAEVQRLAESVPDAAGVFFVPAFTGLGAPYWRPDARGAILGLTRGTSVAHIARAALESIAYQSAALLLAMERDAATGGATRVTELRVDGGACGNDLLMQFQADLLGIPVLRPAVTETTALGVAFLAGLSCGVYGGTDELGDIWRPQRTFHPTMDRGAARDRMAAWERAVRQTCAA